MLLEDGRVLKNIKADPEIIQLMAFGGRCEIVHLLVQDPRLNVGLAPDFSFRYYCEVGDTERVRALLANPQVDPSTQGNVAVMMASSYGHECVVKLLLADPRVGTYINTHTHTHV